MNKDILKRIVTEAYGMGYDDGYNEIYNSEFVGSDQTQLKEILTEEKVIELISDDFLFLTEDDLIAQAKGMDINFIHAFHFMNRSAMERAGYVEYQNPNGEIKVLKNRYT